MLGASVDYGSGVSVCEQTEICIVYGSANAPSTILCVYIYIHSANGDPPPLYIPCFVCEDRSNPENDCRKKESHHTTEYVDSFQACWHAFTLFPGTSSATSDEGNSQDVGGVSGCIKFIKWFKRPNGRWVPFYSRNVRPCLVAAKLLL